MTRATLTLVAKFSAAIGGTLWGLAALYVALFALHGFMITAGPRALLTIGVIICALGINILLFKRADALESNDAVTLVAVSLVLSASLVGWLVYVPLVFN